MTNHALKIYQARRALGQPTQHALKHALKQSRMLCEWEQSEAKEIRVAKMKPRRRTR